MSATVGYWYSIFPPFLYFIQPAMLSSEQTGIANAPGCESDGEGYMSKHYNLSIFTSTSLISLTVCLPWQWLFSDQICVALASAPSLYSAHSGCIPSCCQPNRPVQVAQRHRGRREWRRRPKTAKGKEHMGRRSFQKSFRLFMS